MQNTFLIILLLLILPVNQIFKIKNLFPSYSGEKHQVLTGKKNIQLSGGIFLFLFIILILYEDYNLFCFFLFLVFMLGFLSDINILNSPKIRFFFQVIIFYIFVYYSSLNINSTRIIFLDLILQNLIFSFIFTTFCLIVVVNGSNFIDGLNGLAIGYYLIIIIALLNLKLLPNIFQETQILFFLILFLFILFLLNIFNQLYLGDGGAYLLGFLVSYSLILIYNNSPFISPFYIVLLLWYPCFENLFSVVRKFNFKKSPILPDKNHLHQLIFLVINKKIKNKQLANNLVSLMIISYNIILFSFASTNITNTQLQIILIALSIVLYIAIYLRIFFMITFNKK